MEASVHLHYMYGANGLFIITRQILQTWLFFAGGGGGGGGDFAKCLQDLSHGGNFHDNTPFYLIKSIK